MTAKRQGWMVAVLLLGTAAYALAEEITLTTYYPSPRGVYDQLRARQLQDFDDITFVLDPNGNSRLQNLTLNQAVPNGTFTCTGCVTSPDIQNFTGAGTGIQTVDIGDSQVTQAKIATVSCTAVNPGFAVRAMGGTGSTATVLNCGRPEAVYAP
ncbi:MAG: hypothetical protein HYZ92_02995 [Candidatus Omnitrophica bacterium]|nr:hypothetical protein [Candidatus Omnitrophota bacterium]